VEAGTVEAGTLILGDSPSDVQVLSAPAMADAIGMLEFNSL
jgi:hypothetical protein